MVTKSMDSQVYRARPALGERYWGRVVFHGVLRGLSIFGTACRRAQTTEIATNVLHWAMQRAITDRIGHSALIPSRVSLEEAHSALSAEDWEWVLQRAEDLLDRRLSIEEKASRILFGVEIATSGVFAASLILAMVYAQRLVMTGMPHLGFLIAMGAMGMIGASIWIERRLRHSDPIEKILAADSIP